MITAYEVSKNPGAVQAHDLALVIAREGLNKSQG